MSSPADALLRAYPRRFAGRSAATWVDTRRALLAGRAVPSADLVLAVSSGCASSGAQAHARAMADDAVHALMRLEAGLGTTCEICSTTLPFERLDSAPAAVRCTACVEPSTADTRWCR